jgi:Na+/melibiose symporter-like transporter
MNMNTTYHRVLWRQVWGLAALLAAIVFSWMAYSFYQPVILTKLGFIELAQSLGIIQGFLGAAIEPLAGIMSDRSMHKIGSRLPGIAVGITLAGLLFVATGLLLHSNIPLELRWIVPVLMTFWVIATIVFRGPVVSLLRQFAPTESLPIANSILTFVVGLVGAIGPIFSRAIEFLGAANTFLLGAVMLMGGAILLWSAEPQIEIDPDVDSARSILGANSERRRTKTTNRPNEWLRIFGIGSIAGLLVNILLRICPQQLHVNLAIISPEYIATGMLLVCAIAATPLEPRVRKWGLNRSMLISLIAIAVAIFLSFVLMPLGSIGLAIVIFSGVAMGLLLVAQIPWCLGRFPSRQAGLSTGLYFGGVGAANACLTLIIQLSDRG